MYLRPGGELVLLDEEDIHGTMGFINSEQTLKSGSQGVIKTSISGSHAVKSPFHIALLVFTK